MKFLQKMPLFFFSTMVQKSKNDQKLKSRGFCLALGFIGSLNPRDSGFNIYLHKEDSYAKIDGSEVACIIQRVVFRCADQLTVT